MQVHRLAQAVSDHEGNTMLVVAGHPLFQLNPIAAMIWNKLSEGLTTEQIIDQLARQFDVPQKRIAWDVEGFLEILRQNYLVIEDSVSVDTVHTQFIENDRNKTFTAMRNGKMGLPHLAKSSMCVQKSAENSSIPQENRTSKPKVRTFDLFDTLIGRRCIQPAKIFECIEKRINKPGFTKQRIRAERELAGTQYTLEDIYRRLDMLDQMQVELQIESENIFPIVEMVSKVSVDDVIVSDMYLPINFLRSIVDQTTGLILNPLVVTTDGKGSGEIWKRLNETIQIVEHIGDNLHTDLRMPQKNGISTKLTRVAALSVEEKTLYEDGFIGLAETMREARLTTSGSGLIRRLQLLQIQLNFPLLFLASLALHRRIIADGANNVLISSRDGFLWHHLQEKIRFVLGGTYNVVYFLTSRLARAFPSPDYLQYLNQFLSERTWIVDLCGSGWSLKRLIERSANPETPIFLLAKDNNPAVEHHYRKIGETKQATIQHILNEHYMAVERANFARHPVVKDVKYFANTFFPVFFNPIGVAWQEVPQIYVQHEAFFKIMNIMQQHDFSKDVLVSDEIIAERLAWLNRRIGISGDWLSPWFDDYQGREDQAMLMMLQQKAWNVTMEDRSKKEEVSSDFAV